MKFVLAVTFVLLVLLVLAGCDSGGAPDTPGVVTRPTATTEPVQPHRLRPRDTPTVEEATTNEESTPDTQAEEAPTDVPPVDFGITYTHYEGKSGDWSIDYPEGWKLVEEDPNTQFIEPSEEALIQVTASAMNPSNTNDDLVKLASDNLRQSFGESYVESNREQQNDGSYRIDFTFNIGGADYLGQTFVEGRQSRLYMLFFATIQSAKDSDRYYEIFSHAIDSYVLPEK